MTEDRAAARQVSPLRLLRVLWQFLHELRNVLSLCRASVLSLAIGIVLLAQVQVDDLLCGVADHLPHRSANLWQLVLSVFLWGHANWYFARVMLYFRFPGAPERSDREKALATWAPRVLGTMPMVVFSLACVRARHSLFGLPAQRLALLALASAVLAIVFFALVHRRREMAQFFKTSGMSRLPEQYPDARLTNLAMGTWRYLALWLAVGLLLLALFWWAAPQVAPHVGPLALVLLTACVWVPIVSAATYVSRRWHVPVSLPALLMAIVFSATTDNHAVRTVEQPTANLPVREAFTQWMGTPRPNSAVFFAAAEGGGIRAAYWTAKVLGGLQDDDARFADHLFAVSAVSGGSLGAAVFDALLAERQAGNLRATQSYAEQAKGILGEDFLSPVLASMLYPDLVVDFVPGSAHFTNADRGAVLEKSWERSWRAHVGSERFSQPFLSLWAGTRRLPHLLLNSTCVESGRRFVVSDLVLAPRVGDVADALATIGSDVPLSTAVHLSARFPYLSPAARSPAHPELCAHFVDGGYFDNSGAATLLDLVQSLPDSIPAGGVERSYIPVVIAIDNDPDRTAAPGPLGLLPGLRAPIRTFFGTRSARGRSAEIALAKYVTGEMTLAEPPSRCQVLGDDDDGYYIEFAVSKTCAPSAAASTRPESAVPVPLSWSLSGAAQAQLDCQWNTDSCQAARAKIRELLARGP